MNDRIYLPENKVIGIDATNLRNGGGRTHLIELLRHMNPYDFGFIYVIVWGNHSTLNLLEDRPWLIKINPPSLEGNLISRSIWQIFNLSEEVKKNRCDILFVPGGNFRGNFHPVVTMSQNLLPFEWNEMKRFGFSLSFFKLLILRFSQSASFRKSDGIIFLTDYAREVVRKVLIQINSSTEIIAHGISTHFVSTPKLQLSIEYYSFSNPLRVIYVSIINQYKHQWNVIEAISQLRVNKNWPIELVLVGPAYLPSLRLLESSIKKFDPLNQWVRYQGPIEFEQLHKLYESAHIGLFASSCENLPIILLETMGAGLPIACSNRGPMPSILGDSGIYFDPEKPIEISLALQTLIESPQLRKSLSKSSFKKASRYTWHESAEKTLIFLRRLLDNYNKSKK